ncbi:NACHT domain-containing protein [Arthrobacter sp. 35W]|uniref:NACHT domain-containing protein n=1 Tax=Arthrobacter sp. 35W TaxID=1132441 RepID=UPI0004120052|nr:NACHT domain-containing protein [Arthrobacter sp. 35W]
MSESMQEREVVTANESSATGAAMSPYATGGGGVTFERKVAVHYLARMLTGLGSTELGEGRSVVSVAFQQAPQHSADDLVVRAQRADEDEPSLVLALAVRRAPDIIKSDPKARKLIGSLLAELTHDPGADVNHRVGLVVAGHQDHATQLATLADLARGQSDPEAFVALVQEPNRFERSVRDRFKHLQDLVKLALEDAGGASPDGVAVTQQTWLLLSRLEVILPLLESPDESDWAGIANDLIGVSRPGDLTGAVVVRDRLGVLAATYAPKAAAIDLDILRRDTHHVIMPTTRRHETAWQVLDGLHERAVTAVRSQVTSSDGDHTVHIDRTATITELHTLTTTNPAVIVHGESGVGKSALLIEVASTANRGDDGSQALVINLRHLPATAIEFEHALGDPLATALAEMSAPERLLIIDGADAVAEGKSEQLRYIVDAALHSGVRILASTTNDVRRPLRDIVAQQCNSAVVDYEVQGLTDEQIDGLVTKFPELATLAANAHARELLRRLVVVDLLIRGGVSGLPVTDADAMQEVWSGLVRRHEQTDRGTPDARDTVMLRLAELSLTGGDPLPVVATLDSAALDGLRRDGLLRTSTNQPFKIGPEFAHDEVRRYAVARLLLAAHDPSIRLLAAGMPRWSLSASRLACQIYLEASDLLDNPVRSRFARLQRAFDAVVTAGHGERWGDVPGEALLTLAAPGVLVTDAWTELRANENAGLHRLCRLVDQRLRDPIGLVSVAAVEPLIKQLFDGSTPWFGDKQLQELVRDWLRSLIVANTPANEALRVQLRSQLLGRCATADQREQEEQTAAAAARTARTPEDVERERERAAQSTLFREIGYPHSRRRRRRDLPREITDEVMVEFLALLGPDMGDEGEEILRRIASDAPAYLGPVVEAPLAGRALTTRPQGFLAAMTEAYYLDDEEDGSGFHEDGIRDHDPHGFGMPLAAWYRGPFISLFQSDFRGGVRVLNQLLNHAALARVRGMAGISRYGSSVSDEELDSYHTELQVTGVARTYVGDPHVWTWYRGTGVGPYPCMSALQALERVCDQLIEIDIPLNTIVTILLDRCESLAMVGLVVGLLVRHLEKSNGLLDPYLSEPTIWHLEFARVGSEASGLAASSDGLVGADRRQWSLREASMMLVLRADEDRAEELRCLGQDLIERARQEIQSALGDDDDAIEQELIAVRGWASGMDRDTYSAHPTDDGQLAVQSTPPEALLNALESSSADIQRGREATRLIVQYYINAKKRTAEPRAAETLIADLNIAKQLIDDPPAFSAGGEWDAPAVVVAAALEAHLIEGVELPDDSLRFAAETLVTIAELSGQGRQFDSEESYFEQGADRVAARVLPLLLLPAAARVRALVDGADGSETYARVVQAIAGLASALPNEVRVHLARGLDLLWQVPCSNEGPCHHQTALDLIIATMRDCVFGDWDSEAGQRASTVLEDPVAESLLAASDDVIYLSRLDAALRALAPASVAGICVSGHAEELFHIVLAAQRRALLANERDMDHRGTHALIAARALLTVIEGRHETPLFNHLDTFADRSDLLGAFVRAVSAAAEETSRRAATAARLWPELVTRVLGYEDDHKPFDGRHYGDYARASLIPNAAGEATYLYSELDGEPIVWWSPDTLRDSVEEWLPGARGDSTCVDHLISFIHALNADDQVRIGLPWIADLVLASPEQIARRSYLLSTWLIDIQPAVADSTSVATWQRVVDALVVAGDSKLAPYSQ